MKMTFKIIQSEPQPSTAKPTWHGSSGWGSPASRPSVGKALPSPCPALLYWQGVTLSKCSPETCRITYTFHDDSCNCVPAFQAQTPRPSLHVPTDQSPPDCLSSPCLLHGASAQHISCGGFWSHSSSPAGRAPVVPLPRGKGHGSLRCESPSGQWGSCCPHTPTGRRLQEPTHEF